MIYSIFGFLLCGLCVAYMPVHAQSSVLASGNWYKVAVEKHGVYKISHSTFKKMGFDLSKTDPRNIRIYGNEGGMLPQANAATRAVDLIENAIFVSGESDGIFDNEDYILFYGWGPNRWYPNGLIDFSNDNNIYSDLSYYFININPSNTPLRLTSINSSASPVSAARANATRIKI